MTTDGVDCRIGLLVAQVEGLKQSKSDMRQGYLSRLEENKTTILRLQTVLANSQRRFDQVRRVVEDPGGTMADIRQFFR